MLHLRPQTPQLEEMFEGLNGRSGPGAVPLAPPLGAHPLAVASLPALGPWTPPAERGPSLESIYRVSLTLDLCEGNKIISFKKLFHHSQLGALQKEKHPGALGTCPVCPFVKTALAPNALRSRARSCGCATDVRRHDGATMHQHRRRRRGTKWLATETRRLAGRDADDHTHCTAAAPRHATCLLYGSGRREAEIEAARAHPRCNNLLNKAACSRKL